MEVVRSIIDESLPDPDPVIENRLQNPSKFQAAFTSFSRNGISEDQLQTVTQAFLHRTHPTNDGFRYLLATIEGSEGNSQNRNIRAERLAAIAEGHQAFSDIARPVEISLTPGITLTTKYGLVGSIFEAAGGVHFLVKDGPHELPLYAFRGNPEEKDTGMSFPIRAVQPWVGDTAIISALTNPDSDEKELISAEEMVFTKEILQQRRKKIDRLRSIMNQGPGVTEPTLNLKEADIMLLLGMAYLQGIGVTEIRGVKQEAHPDQWRMNGSFNYNDFFGRWTDEYDRDPIHPWILHSGAPSGYLPHFLQLPAGMRKAALSMYQAANELQVNKS
jgi:hypothetical protein